MTDHPIIFSAPMVKSILAGRKTQTRRILKPQIVCHTGPVPSFTWWKFSGLYPDDWFGYGNEIDGALPYAVGDRLWVREACRAEETPNGIDGVRYAADDAWRVIENTPEASDDWVDLYHYRSRGKNGRGNPVPSIHMPRWASRITLEVTEVRVQRLQEISEEDAKAEGLTRVSKDGKIYKWGIPDRDGLPGNDDLGWHWQDWERDPRAAYTRLWNSLHGPDAWAANPWVCCLTFKRVE